MAAHGGSGVDLDAAGAEPLREDDPGAIGGMPLLGRLGAGGMGRVFLGLGEEGFTAVKQVLPQLAEDTLFLRRFGHELDNLERLPPQVSARLVASDRKAVPPWFATDYVPGLDLYAAVAEHGPLPVPALWLLLREVAARLETVHQLSVLHRDLKPSNVMLTSGGGLTLLDFGIARAADQSRVTRTGMVIGTPGYMAPEQAASGDAPTAAPADVFSLGSLLYFAATGRPPYGEGSGPDVLYRVVHESCDLAPVRAVDSQLAAVIAACHAKDPADRPTASELRQDGADAAAAWSGELEAKLARRVAFAATAGALDRKALLGAVKTEEQKPEKPRRRRRLAPVVVPVLIGSGVAVTMVLLPYFPSTHASAGPTPSSSVAASGSANSVGPSVSTSAHASASVRAAHSASPSASHSRDGTGSSGTSSGTSGSSGKTGSSSSGGSSGSSGSGGSGGTTSAGAPTGTHALRDSGTGLCLEGNSPGMAMTTTCGGSDQSWTFTRQSGGGFTVTTAMGMCLTMGNSSGAAAISGCATDQGYHPIWELGPTPSGGGFTLRNVYLGECLQDTGDSYGGMYVVNCDAAKPEQVWKLT